jgi:hypothetical protein
VYKIELLQDSNTPFWSFVVLVLLFFVCEILPIVALLDYSYLNMVGLERVEIRWASSEDEMALSSQATPDPLFASHLMGSVNSPSRSIRWRDEVDADPLLPRQTENNTGS